jgi:hypothetical protein
VVIASFLLRRHAYQIRVTVRLAWKLKRLAEKLTTPFHPGGITGLKRKPPGHAGVVRVPGFSFSG